MTLLDIADMLADVLDFEDVYAGNIDANKDKCIGVYPPKIAYPQAICVGGKTCTKTNEKRISILIHWTDNPTVAEIRAQEVLERLTDIRAYTAGGYSVCFIKCLSLQSVGRDERGINEYVIDAIIYYERKE